MELSHSPSCCKELVLQGCLPALVLCIDDRVCGRFAAQTLLHASELEEASPIILADLNIALMLRALRDEEVDWKEYVCVALAHATRWPRLLGLSLSSVRAISRAIIDHFDGGYSRDDSTSEFISSLVTVNNAVFNVSAEKNIRRNQQVSSTIKEYIGYLMYAFSNCIGKVVDNCNNSFLSEAMNRDRVIFIIECALRPDSSATDASSASLILHNCACCMPDWDHKTAGIFIGLVGKLLQKCSLCVARFDGFSGALKTCQFLSRLDTCRNNPELMGILGAYIIEFEYLSRTSDKNEFNVNISDTNIESSLGSAFSADHNHTLCGEAMECSDDVVFYSEIRTGKIYHHENYSATQQEQNDRPAMFHLPLKAQPKKYN